MLGAMDASRVVECRCYHQHGGGSGGSKRLRLSQRGLVLSTEPSPPLAPKLGGRVIRWSDVLGAAELDATQRAHVPGHPLASPSESSREFVVFGCLSTPHALEWTTRGAGVLSSWGVHGLLDALLCWRGDEDGDDATDAKRVVKAADTLPAFDAADASNSPPTTKDEGAAQRVLVQWVLRYTGKDADTYVPRVVHEIRRLADPRIARSIRSGGAPRDREPQQLPRRKYLVLINPAGGPGKAKQIFDSVVAPVLQQSDTEYEAIVTEYRHHASEIVAKVPLNTFDCIVAVGGDGLLSEILQGVMSRPDWKQAIQQPLGIVPGGSGNGLSASLLHRGGEAMEALSAAYALVKGSASELDISSVRNAKGDVMYSFLSLEWAFIADVDIDSERFRMFGGLRFAISTVAKLLSRRQQYSGTLRYLSSGSDDRAPTKYHETARDSIAPPKEGETRPALECCEAQQPTLEAPSEWKEISGAFHIFWAMSVSHASSDGHIAPGAAMDDGYYYLMVMVGPFSRLNHLRMLMGLETGTHVGKPQVQLIRTRAFTLSTDNPSDRICVDGELFAGSQLQVEVHRALGRMMCLPTTR